jgi:hypothetical protein
MRRAGLFRLLIATNWIAETRNRLARTWQLLPLTLWHDSTFMADGLLFARRGDRCSTSRVALRASTGRACRR